MKNDIGERTAILETKVKTLERDHESWNTLIKKVITQLFLWLAGIITSGVMFGWHLPESIRKSIAEWVSK